MRSSDEYIYGIHAVQEAIRSGREMERVLIDKNARGDGIRELLTLVRASGQPFQTVPREKLQQYTRKNHQGVVAVLSPVIYQKVELLVPALYEQGKVPFLLMLDGITDVRNFGAIARTAECAGVHGMIIPMKGNAQVTADALKTSSGALNTLPVCRTPDLARTARFLKDSGLSLIAVTEKAERSYFEASFSGPLALVLGSEYRGISAGVLKTCDEFLKIPLYGNIASLNASVAAALMIYEVVRQREFKK